MFSFQKNTFVPLSADSGDGHHQLLFTPTSLAMSSNQTETFTPKMNSIIQFYVLTNNFSTTSGMEAAQ